ncbi:hypothetical protein NDU88_001682 [Pleurodeles waltl]|uniref:Uncharacterized protein n=1 Tax=Pleurodeles waltl TaxID=8319 RepID=A0AAV7U752_PLEWA|nr:hypothetical protein NDU88_001682 [Pleurodeles waltl]
MLDVIPTLASYSRLCDRLCSCTNRHPDQISGRVIPLKASGSEVHIQWAISLMSVELMYISGDLSRTCLDRTVKEARSTRRESELSDLNPCVPLPGGCRRACLSLEAYHTQCSLDADGGSCHRFSSAGDCWAGSVCGPVCLKPAGSSPEEASRPPRASEQQPPPRLCSCICNRTGNTALDPRGAARVCV